MVTSSILTFKPCFSLWWVALVVVFFLQVNDAVNVDCSRLHDVHLCVQLLCLNTSRVYTEMYSTQNGHLFLHYLSGRIPHPSSYRMTWFVLVHILHVRDEILACLWSSISCTLFLVQDAPTYTTITLMPMDFFILPPAASLCHLCPWVPFCHLHWFLTSGVFCSKFSINLKIESQCGIKYWCWTSSEHVEINYIMQHSRWSQSV